MAAYSIPATRAQFLLCRPGPDRVISSALNPNASPFIFKRDDATTQRSLAREDAGAIVLPRRSQLITQSGSHGGGHPPGNRCVVASLR